MDWDHSQVTYSTQLATTSTTDQSTNYKAIQSKFRQFLREFRKGNVEETFYYREKLQINYDERQYKLVVDFRDLGSFDPDLCENFREKPAMYLPLFETAALEVIAMTKVPKPAKNDMHAIQIQMTNLETTRIQIRKLQSEHISKLVRVPGMIISATKPSAKAISLTLQCSNCKATITRASARGFGSIQLPRTCDNSTDEKNDKPCPLDPFTIIADKCNFVDIQKLKLQEQPEDIPTGEMPRHIWLFCERRLVNRVKPGARVNIIGIYKIFGETQRNRAMRQRGRSDSTVRQPYVEVIGIEEENVVQKHGKFTAEEEEMIRDFARKTTDVPGIIAKSIAPAIWGSKDIKKAIACLLFGGSRKVLPDGMRLRGDINVLLLGDPSVAKSQFLKFVDEVAPIAVYTSGKGSSAAGLTASVIKDAASGEFHLEAGAMVLADGGVVCIDEFDKMRESDRVAIHEAMEQQTISIAKAGITTILNSRTSVLAAANPIFGRYDDLRNTSENIDFEATILSRFDLIFIIRDIKDRAKDTKLAEHIMDLHINVSHGRRGGGGGGGGSNSNDNNNEEQINENEIHPDLLSKYISFARHRIHPRLTRNAANMLKNHYVLFRREAKIQAEQTGQLSGIPLTVRQLESLVRIAESLAKMELSPQANEVHVKEAVRLFKVSTLKAAKEGNFSGEGALADPEVVEQIQKCERNIRRRLPIGSKTSVSKLIAEMARRNLAENVVGKALDIMQSRGEIEFRQRRNQIYRRK